MFKEAAANTGICIAHIESLKSNDKDNAFDDFIDHILNLKSVKVVVCACEGLTVRGLFGAIKRKNASGKLIILGR